MSEFLFVYGSLRKARDGSLHPFLNHQAEFIALARLSGALYHIDAYPGAVLLAGDSGALIQGELYRLLRPHLSLQQLDDYEECSGSFPAPREYRREQVSVSLPDNSYLQAWAYIYQQSTGDLQRINSGDYSSFLPDSHYRRLS